jgi:SAM-dependent methyltransferase
MFDFHTDVSRYFEMQRLVTQNFIIPFLKTHHDFSHLLHVLEIGCAEAGVLKAFLDEGHSVVGVELLAQRVENARKFLQHEISEGKAHIINKNIFDINTEEDQLFHFDIIILKDVIEHIPNKPLFMEVLKKFMKPNSIIFFAYPPWYMPFGGHQQVCRNRFLRLLPWFHLLPVGWYRRILNWGGESEVVVEELLEIKETGINIGGMYDLLKSGGFEIMAQKFWLLNPIYAYKFGKGAIKLPKILAHIPVLRNFYTTAHYISFTYPKFAKNNT